MRLDLKITSFFVTLMLVMAGGVWAGSAAQSDDGGTPALKGPQAVFLESNYKFEPMFEGDDVTHDFVVENRGDAPLVIKNVKPG